MSPKLRKRQFCKAIITHTFRMTTRNSSLLRMIIINQGGRNRGAAWRTYIGILSGDIDPKEVGINA